MIDAVFAIDKPEGPTSFDIVRQIKRVFPKEKVGHAGSLDPFATGVLVILVGKATKHSGLLLNADKSYRAMAKLGESTDSMDRTGQVDAQVPIPELSVEAVKDCVEGMQGEWWQTPPMFSAKKVHGVRLYDLARQNIKVRRPPEKVMLYEMKFARWDSPWLGFDVRCSKGTYIRSLADALGKKLGTVGHLYELRRYQCGPFGLENCVSPDALAADPGAWLDKGRQNFLSLMRLGRTLFPETAAPSRSSFANGL